FAIRLGKPINKVNEIIKGKIAITPTTSLRLERVLGIPASFWNTRQKNYDEFLAFQKEEKLLKNHLTWLKKFPINEMIKNNWISKQNDDILQLKSLLSFFGISSPEEWNSIWMSPKVAYKQSIAFSKIPESNSVWLRRGEILAQQINCNIYDAKEFRNVLNTIRNFMNRTPKDFSNQMLNLCSHAGVALVFVERPKGLPVYGITKWLTKNKALIQLSLYRKYEDYMWFSFFHEAAHILLHGKSDVFIETKIIDNSEKENEADKFASKFLIPEKKWKNFIALTTKFDEQSIIKFAKDIDICPGIIVGRLQREKHIHFSKMNHLRRKVEFN
ncbi:MAG: ImmA/IrrE family metallo-endopeptidase, partial [Candidatus Cloacimonetes bacterium]|nr:ImmA/IrrE family metallo-endopeptidase [Candidatus Cloacimonadota bacterium]